MPHEATTTIEIRKSTLEKLRQQREGSDRNWSDAIERLMSDQGLIYVKLIAVDGELPDSSDHQVILQVGDAPAHYYKFIHGKAEEMPKLPAFRMVPIPKS